MTDVVGESTMGGLAGSPPMGSLYSLWRLTAVGSLQCSSWPPTRRLGMLVVPYDLVHDNSSAANKRFQLWAPPWPALWRTVVAHGW